MDSSISDNSGQGDRASFPEVSGLPLEIAEPLMWNDSFGS